MVLLKQGRCLQCRELLRISRCREKGAREAANEGDYCFCGYERCWQSCKEGMCYSNGFQGTVTKYMTHASYYITERYIWRLWGWKRWWRTIWCEFPSFVIILSLILLQTSNQLTKLESELACLCGLLEKKCSNDHDAGYTYVDPVSSDSVALTPFMMKEWAHAMVVSFTNTNPLNADIFLQYDGMVSVSHPPPTATFDPINRKSSLYTHHCRPESTSTSALPIHGISGDLANLSHIISSVASITHTPSKPPTTPTHPHMSSSASSIHSPTWNTPSKLTWFLEYVETFLCIENACSYEESLWILGFGPDILHLVDDGVLKDVGFTPGDVIHLKQSSQQWWNSANAKCKWTSQISPVQLTSPNKRVTFKKQYHNGGGYRLYGPRIIKGDCSPNADIDWFYFCKAQETMVPLPFGYVAVLDGEWTILSYIQTVEYE